MKLNTILSAKIILNSQNLIIECEPRFDSSYLLGGLEAGSARRYVSPAKQFYCSSIGVVDSVGVIYKAFGDASKVGLLVFLELWLRMYPLSCGSGEAHPIWL